MRRKYRVCSFRRPRGEWHAFPIRVLVRDFAFDVSYEVIVRGIAVDGCLFPAQRGWRWSLVCGEPGRCYRLASVTEPAQDPQ